MTVHLVTFSDESMDQSANLCVTSAKANGVSIAHRSGLSDVAGLLRRHGIDPTARGCGYWAWKPAIILETMNRLGVVDTAFGLHGSNYIIYVDAGVEFIGNINEIIRRMDQDVWLFGNNWEHAHWCKADVMEEIGPWGWFGKQCQASVIFFRVSEYSRVFVSEWLNWCLFEGGRLIDDSPSRTPNHPEFREHRHDQAILTTMAYREGIKLHWWPASYNDGAFVYEKLPQYASDTYPPLFNHHRRRNHEWAKCA